MQALTCGDARLTIEDTENTEERNEFEICNLKFEIVFLFSPLRPLWRKFTARHTNQ